mgnify:CR=1 FL=1
MAAMLRQWRNRLTVPQFTVLTGVLVIAAGTLLLASPLCSTASVGLWEALFTVTSAITVTGLSIIDVGQELTPLGQGVLALLILTGGLGLMAITTFLQGFVQGRSGLRHRLDKGRALDEFGVGGIGPTFNSILLTATCVMGLGTVVLYAFGFTDIDNPAGDLAANGSDDVTVTLLRQSFFCIIYIGDTLCSLLFLLFSYTLFFRRKRVTRSLIHASIFVCNSLRRDSRCAAAASGTVIVAHIVTGQTPAHPAAFGRRRKNPKHAAYLPNATTCFWRRR